MIGAMLIWLASILGITAFIGACTGSTREHLANARAISLCAGASLIISIICFLI
jgi:hypothetical protein